MLDWRILQRLEILIMSGKILVEDTAKVSDSADIISWTQAPHGRWDNIRQGKGGCFNFPRGVPREDCHFCQRHPFVLLGSLDCAKPPTSIFEVFVPAFQDGG